MVDDPEDRWWRHGFPMPDDKLVEYARSFRRGIIEDKPSDRYCFMICAPLTTLLNVEGCMCRMVEGQVAHDGGRNHYWIVFPDGRVLDPTLDQFGDDRPDVYLGDPIPGIHSAVPAKP
jgi:hypothetical protein